MNPENTGDQRVTSTLKIRARLKTGMGRILVWIEGDRVRPALEFAKEYGDLHPKTCGDLVK